MVQHEPRWLNSQQVEMWHLMIDARRKVERDLEDLLQAVAGLSQAEYSVLLVLSTAEKQQIRVRDVCTALNWDRSRASHQLSRMRERGLVEKTKCVGDGRGLVVFMTEEGKRRFQDARPVHVEALNRLVFDHMSNEQARILHRYLLNVMDATVVIPQRRTDSHSTSSVG